MFTLIKFFDGCRIILPNCLHRKNPVQPSITLLDLVMIHISISLHELNVPDVYFHTV